MCSLNMSLSRVLDHLLSVFGLSVHLHLPVIFCCLLPHSFSLCANLGWSFQVLLKPCTLVCTSSVQGNHWAAPGFCFSVLWLGNCISLSREQCGSWDFCFPPLKNCSTMLSIIHCSKPVALYILSSFCLCTAGR